jgi:PTH1 family peptidyl-tRNA hydrolase
MKIIVGLGNPGKKYNLTRHNAGFMAVEEIAREKNLTWQLDKKLEAEMAKGGDLILVKPTTFMNESGRAVQKILAYYNLAPQIPNANLKDVLVVIHDDLDLNLGAYKIATGSQSAGHHGLDSIMKILNTKNFTRVRLGLATENLQRARKSILPGAVARFVLKRFPASEQKIILETINQSKQAIL